jgi:organic radical activating enzyme
METMSLASLEEEIYLRGLTGYIVAKRIFDGYKNIAIITYPDRICSSLSSSLVSSLISKQGYRDKIARIYLYDENKLNDIAKDIVKNNFDSVFIVYGGEQKVSYVSEITKKTILALKNAGYKNSLLIHVRIWIATKQLSEILNDEIKEYLKSLKEIRVFTADLQNKLFIFHKVKIDNEIKLEKYAEEKITDEHVELLKKSVPPK